MSWRDTCLATATARVPSLQTERQRAQLTLGVLRLLLSSRLQLFCLRLLADGRLQPGCQLCLRFKMAPALLLM